VQDALEHSLAGIAGRPVTLIGAGRTDTGVHALGQVAHFDTEAVRPASAWIRGTNSSLPAGVAVQWAKEVDADFHARFDARERCYVYLLSDRPVRPAVLHGRVGWFHRALDVDAMQKAASLLIGSHDFSAFRSSECQSRTPVRDLREFRVERVGQLVRFTLRANAFLHRMVRNLVGGLVYVGKGAQAPQWMREILDGRDRTRGAPTFAPDGLYLVDVRYEEKWGLPRPAAPDPLTGWWGGT